MEKRLKKTIKGFLVIALLLPTTSKPIIVPHFPEDFVKVDDAPQLTQLSVGKNEVWGVFTPEPLEKKYTKEDAEKCKIHWYHTVNKIWKEPAKGKLKYVSVGEDNKPWGIGTNDVSYECNAAKTGWKNKGGKRLFKISVGKSKPNYIWTINTKGELFYWIGGIKGWTKFKQPDDKSIKHVSCGYDGERWVIGKDDDSVWRWNQKGNKWDEVKGGLKQVDVGDKDHVVGIDTKNVAKIYNPSSQKWEIIGEGIKNISINKDGEIWLIATNNKTYWSKQLNVAHIRKAADEAKKKAEEAKKSANEAKEASKIADEQAKKRATETAQYFAKEVEKEAKKAQEESTKADKAYQDVMQAAKTLDVVAAEEAFKQAKTAAQNAQIAARKATRALFEVTT